MHQNRQVPNCFSCILWRMAEGERSGRSADFTDRFRNRGRWDSAHKSRGSSRAANRQCGASPGRHCAGGTRAVLLPCLRPAEGEKGLPMCISNCGRLPLEAFWKKSSVVPTMATGTTGRPVCSAINAMPGLAGCMPGLCERSPSGAIKSGYPLRKAETTPSTAARS